MRHNYNRFICLFVAICCLCQTGEARGFWPFKKKKKEEKKEVLTPYQKLFKGKKVQTAHGLMTIHKVGDKIYVEFPTALLGRDMLLVSSIENISDGGEGMPGQLGGSDVRLQFEMIDSTIVARMPLLSKPVNSSNDGQISGAINEAHNPGIFKSFKVLACTPDSNALVIDMKGLFLEGSSFTKPFPKASANGYYGFVSRSYSLQDDKSSILGVGATAANISVREEVCYSVDHNLMGAYDMYSDVPLTAMVNKMLYLLPETPMKPRVADSRLGMSMLTKTDFPGAGKEVKEIRYAKRWRIEPSDTAAYKRGEKVTPRKPLVFYVDSLMPSHWFPYIKAGAESWNRAFEKIGFKDVISVRQFPRQDSLFNADNLETLTIRYAPSWMNMAQVTVHADVRTGEILNASILLNANLISVHYIDRIAATAATDPRVRGSVFPQELQGEMLQAAVAQAVGQGLGLTINDGAAYAFPVDSLRSEHFTRTYGLAPSVMTNDVLINDIATADDVKRGVLLVNNRPGLYDELVIRYLYAPTFSASPQAEKEVLDGWIREHSEDLRYAYVRSQPSFDSDPRNVRGGLGSDALKSFGCMLSNVRESYAHYHTWFADKDKDYYWRGRVRSTLLDRVNSRMYALLSYIGGIYLNETRADYRLPSCEMVPKEQQKAALASLLAFAKELDWVDNSPEPTAYPLGDKKATKMRLDLFNGLFARLPYVEVCTEHFPEAAYTATEFLDDLQSVVWDGLRAGRALTDFEKALQTSFVESIISTSSSTAPVGSFSTSGSADALAGYRHCLKALRDGQRLPADALRMQSRQETAGFRPLPPVHTNHTRDAATYFDLLSQTQEMLEKAISTCPQADKAHYELLFYRIEKAVQID